MGSEIANTVVDDLYCTKYNVQTNILGLYSIFGWTC